MEGDLPAEAIVYRRYRPQDREAVRRICGDTGFFGRPLEEVFHEREVMVDGLISYYTDFEPESLWVVEVRGEVKGYLSGCRDTLRALRIFSIQIVPRLVVVFFLRGHFFRWRSWWMLGAGAILGWRRGIVLQPILSSYPAHFHINLEAGWRKQGLGSQLVKRFLESLERDGIRAVHGCVATEGGLALCQRFGFQELASFPLPPFPCPAPSRCVILGKRL